MFLAAVFCALAVLCALPAASVGKAKAPAAKLKIVGGEKARTVVLTPGKVHGGLHGRVGFLVKNSGNKAATLTVTFISANRGGAVQIAPNTTRFSLDPKGRPLRIGKQQMHPLAIRVNLPPGKGVSGTDGCLLFHLGDETRMVRLVGALPEFKDVLVEPASLSMDTDHRTSKITLVGSGVLEFLRLAGPSPPKGILYGRSGTSVGVTVELPAADEVATSSNPDRVEAEVRLDDPDPPAGKYTGKVPLSSASPTAPVLEVELHAHDSFWWLVACAFVGVFLGGLLTRLATLAMRRKLLLMVLGQSLDAYKHVRCFVTEPSSWSIQDLLNVPKAPGSDKRRLQGVPGLKASIRSARSTKDLDEDATRVLATIAHVQRWLRVEPVARQLALVAEKDSPKPLAAGDKEKVSWQSTVAWRDTHTLLAAVKREPENSKAADDLVTRLLDQIQWHHRLAEAWVEGVGHPRRADAEKRAKELVALANSDEMDPKTGLRTPAQQDILDAKLQAFADSPQDPKFKIKFTDPERPAEPTSTHGVTPVRWGATPNLFTGWATLDEQSYGQLTRRATSTARSIGRISLKTEWNALGWLDLIWSLVTLLLASLVWGIAKYGDTWGSTQDLIAAGVAGATGAVIVNWAALPVFQSVRLRGAEKDAAAAAAPKPDAKAEVKAAS